MRFNYYRFEDNTPEDVLLKNGCAVVLKSGDCIYVDSIPDDKRHLVDYIDRTICGGTVTYVKSLIKACGGCGWTEHCERDGSVFEITNISIGKNNSRFKYNHHL